MTPGPPVRLVVTGPECTGKTTLAGELAASLGTVVSPEYARAYAGRAARPLTARDVEPIARGQIAGENEALEAARRAGARWLVLDTDLVSTGVYARHYYGECPAWIDEEARARRGDLYLLLHPDVPWVAEPFMRDQPGRRGEQLVRFRAALASIGARVVEIRGGWDERREAALAAARATGRR